MSVIITGMTMPNSCNDCGIVAEKAKTTCKSNGCPLKSVDGLIERMKGIKDIPDQGTWRSAVDECIATVEVYCEVESEENHE